MVSSIIKEFKFKNKPAGNYLRKKRFSRSKHFKFDFQPTCDQTDLADKLACLKHSVNALDNWFDRIAQMRSKEDQFKNMFLRSL